ncbi:hypothetical protein GCM10009584_12380 [Ornithinimicrobium humiphilum]|uniref:Uncharacterized protein n=1 Tax=Ornithinimicrobium humiphilum TaxID=125288 RepID=A0A543KJT2_9MICO|nr:hypothetical protein FB476_0180 [Ornithinimicrobium humiphilum]
MLADIGIEGVTGIGVLPGALRRMLGVTHEFRTPADFEGAVVQSELNAAAVAMLEALGADEPVAGVEANALDGLDGLVAHVGAVVGNTYQDDAVAFTTNLNLWPDRSSSSPTPRRWRRGPRSTGRRCSRPRP